MNKTLIDSWRTSDDYRALARKRAQTLNTIESAPVAPGTEPVTAYMREIEDLIDRETTVLNVHLSQANSGRERSELTAAHIHDIQRAADELWSAISARAYGKLIPLSPGENTRVERLLDDAAQRVARRGNPIRI